MELREVIKNLTVKSDICLLDSEQIINKYCKDEKTYNEFINVFSRVFSRRKLFPIIVAYKYRNIEEVINVGKQFSNLDIEEKEVGILREIYKNEHQEYLDLKGDDYGQAISLFNGTLGALKVKEDISSCGEKMRKMKACAEIYNNSDKKISMDEHLKFVNDVYSSDELERPNRMDSVLSNCYAENPKMLLCFNNEFLYLVNYLIQSHPECCDEVLINFVKNIILISIESDDLAPKDFSKKSYSKLAKHTLHKIDKFEKEKINLNEPKKKKMSFFKK